MGRWYEIAALPNFFQRHCLRDTTADYSLRDDGTIAVTNRCETELGEFDEARGAARRYQPSLCEDTDYPGVVLANEGVEGVTVGFRS
jgi:lipocalin